MAVRKINESTLTAIGNAIRSKTGGSALINPEDMADEIENISTSATKEVTGFVLQGINGGQYNSGTNTLRLSKIKVETINQGDIVTIAPTVSSGVTAMGVQFYKSNNDIAYDGGWIENTRWPITIDTSGSNYANAVGISLTFSGGSGHNNDLSNESVTKVTITKQSRAAPFKILADGGIVLPPNMLDGLTWERGYFSTSGTISDATGNKELYCNEYIPVESGEKYFIGQKSPSSNNIPLWSGINYYDANNTFIARVLPQGFDNQGNCYPIWFSTFRINATTKFIRVSFRSFGESSLYICKASDFFEAIKDSAVNLIY